MLVTVVHSHALHYGCFFTGGGLEQHRDGERERENHKDKMSDFVWVNMNLMCVLLVGLSVLLCFFVTCRSIEQHKNPTISVSV